MAFLNIFSKSKAKNKHEKSKIKIIIDHREKNSLVASYLASQGFNIEFQQLPVADYLVDNIAIERKTISDLKSSIINKRIMSQLLELKQYQKFLLILEGLTQEDIYEGIIHENALRGFLLSVILDYQVPIIYTLNEKDTASYLAVLAKKSPKKDFSLRASKIIMTQEENLRYILEGFPQIGPVTAKRLLEHFKTLKEITNASEEELQKVIGKKSESFYKLLHHKYKK